MVTNIAAIEIALALKRRPQLVRQARRQPLPSGISILLQIAVGEPVDIGPLTADEASSLEAAANFFIEQVLLAPSSDSYRVLGAAPDAPAAELRLHMALLMRWLHPDAVLGPKSTFHFDRSAYAQRVAQAWDCLKTTERRSAYDAMRRQETVPKKKIGFTHDIATAQSRKPPRSALADLPWSSVPVTPPRLTLIEAQHPEGELPDPLNKGLLHRLLRCLRRAQ